MRVRLVALLGSLALLAILGAPTLAMSLKEHVPTAPWQWSRGPAVAAPARPPAGPPAAAGERHYLAGLAALHERAVAAARQLEQSPRARVRRLAAAVVADRSGELARVHRWLARWYPGLAEVVANGSRGQDLPTLSATRVERALLRDVISDQMAAVAMSRHLLADHLAVHPAVARLARHVQRDEHAQMHRLQHWLAIDLGGPWPHGTGPRMMGR